MKSLAIGLLLSGGGGSPILFNPDNETEIDNAIIPTLKIMKLRHEEMQ